MVKSLGIYPYFREISSAQDTVVTIEGREVLMFGSNSYLGLTNHPEIKKAAIDAVERYGTGCSGSRFLNGSLDIHRMLEEELADLVGLPGAIVFSTGFQANLGAISAMVDRGEYVVTDRLDHASIIDGCRLSYGRKLKFQHNDLEDLDRVLRALPPESGKLVVVDGVYSMEGDIAPLPEIATVCERHRAGLMVDDAHGIGVMGKCGAGTVNHFGLEKRVQIIMGTFSKSLASLGGFIAADADTIEYLKHKSRALIFSASMPPSNVEAVRAALRIMRREPERIERLWEITARMREGLRSIGYDIGPSETPIIPVRVGDSLTAFKMCKELQNEGVFVNPVVAPAVPEGECILRVSLMATHTPEQVDVALAKMEQVGRALHVV
ncbi:MAG TPA: aminotransferase class I/II-fold pyridoxal phosphate-dependent enzyme [bacterium]